MAEQLTFFRTRDAWLLTVVALSFGLTGCGGNTGYDDINVFMTQVKQEALVGIAEIPATELYQPFSYGASNLRSPFVPPVVVAPQSEEQRRNLGVKPPRDHAKQFLERYNIVSLAMVGTLRQNTATWALIKDESGGVHRVQVGDYMGKNWGKVESINDTRIDITEIVSDGAQGWLRRPRTIELNQISE